LAILKTRAVFILSAGALCGTQAVRTTDIARIAGSFLARRLTCAIRTDSISCAVGYLGTALCIFATGTADAALIARTWVLFVTRSGFTTAETVFTAGKPIVTWLFLASNFTFTLVADTGARAVLGVFTGEIWIFSTR